MSEFLAALVGALVGGGFAMWGSWLGIRWQAAHNSHSLAAAILAEITTIDRVDKENRSEQFYTHFLDHIDEHGEVPNPEVLAAALDQDPTISFPVFYGNVSNLGLLPTEICQDIIAFHAKMQGLRISALRYLCGPKPLPPDRLRALSRELRSQYDDVQKRRRTLRAGLEAHLAPKGILAKKLAHPPRRPANIT